ncbi:protein Asterix [Podospora australis]|uniref:Protein Asterix n=1 Tax=Podospora australis TaxID=1536484 RepID=A0AAN6X284_9PEZI|nr:protein Asterix [Podospora australis]
MEVKKEKDVRRADLIVPFQEPAGKSEGGDFNSTLASTLPMAAIFMRNRYIGWASVAFSLQSWLGESEETKKSASSPGYFSVGMSLMSLVVTYLPFFLPPAGRSLGQGTATDAPPPAPL